MRRYSLILVVVTTAALSVGPAAAVPPPTVAVGPDVRITGRPYVRNDGGTDPTIQACNDRTTPEVFGGRTQNNEPFSLVDPTNPDLVIAGWNDYCSGWVGLGFSNDGGDTWANTVIPGYPADTSAEGMASPEYIRTNAAGDPIAGFDTQGHFYAGGIAFNRFAGPKTNGDVFVSTYDVVDPATNGGRPIDYVRTVRVATGTPSANFNGQFNDKPMMEVDRSGGRTDGNVYVCWSRFVGFGQNKIFFSRSTNGGATFSKPLAISGNTFVQGCDIAVEADGDVYVSWRVIGSNPSKKTNGLAVARSANGGASFADPVRIASIRVYNPFDGARDCGDGLDLCPSGFVFARAPLEPRLTSDPTGELPGIYAIYNMVDPDTVEASDTTYTSAGAGSVGQSKVYVSRSLDDGATWSAPSAVSDVATGHQIFPDGDALDGALAIVWQDSRTDDDYSVQLPIGNLPDATTSGDDAITTMSAVSFDGVTFGSLREAASETHNPQWEQFGGRDVPFMGDYNWIQLVGTEDGLFGFMSWTDGRNTVPGDDPREETQDGFDVLMCLDADLVNQCPNSGGFDQDIYGAPIRIG